MKDVILNTVEDLVSNFTYYDRKNDEELTEKQLDEAIENGIITVDEIVSHFKECLNNVYKNKDK
ncbi:hypothetical protein [Elizabethkingia phage TCUEAP2]|nr:hypothetical protein [Elizabethkingia phage TCUEAP2]